MPDSPSSSNKHFLPESKESNETNSSTSIAISPDNKYYNHDTTRKSYQLRALGRKTVSYQKRQWFVNICCLSICPFMMVAIGGILGIVVTNLIQKNSPPPTEYLMCSSADASNEYGFPNPLTNLPGLPPSEVPNAKFSSPVIELNVFVAGAGYDAFNDISSDSLQTCTFWFEHNYPYRMPYEPDPGVSIDRRKDTTFKPSPKGGWFGPSLLSDPLVLGSLQTLPWTLVLDKPGVSSGQKRMRSPVSNIMDIRNRNANDSGLLGSMETNYFLNFGTMKEIPKELPNNEAELLSIWENGGLPSILEVPYFDKGFTTKDDIDDELSRNIRSTLSLINDIVYPKDINALPDYYKKIVNVYRKLPWGSMLFDEVSPNDLKWDYTLQTGTNKRISKAVSTYPKRGLRNIALQSKLSNAFLKSSPQGADAMISHGFRVMPQLISTEINVPIGSLIGGILYPFGISFLIPIFVLILVKEKEDRILVMMRMNGLSPRAYYLAHYVHFYILHIISSIVFVITGVGFQMSIFTATSPFVYIFLLFIWGHAQIALAFLLSAFFGKTRTALVTSFLIVLCGVICNLGFEVIFNGDAPMGYYFWLPFAFYHGLHVINMASIDPLARPYTLVNMLYPGELAKALIALGVGTIIYLMIAFYLIMVLPSAYGVRKPWYFLFTWLFRRSNKKSLRDENLPQSLKPEDKELLFEDDDVRSERDRVLRGDYEPKSPLVMKNMRKIYAGNKIAVKNVTFTVEPNIVFGLLGPNGAGKTTLISILTGLYQPTSGQAFLGGFDVNTEMKQVYLNTGVCPQHDILWEDLTVEEHLLYYARLKGVKPSEEKSMVEKALTNVSLHKFKN
ncbi:hypothetical protein K7432_014492, partial [Basidiobolus ranarum]